MIIKIVSWTFGFSLFVAFILAGFGVTEVTVDNNYMVLLRDITKYIEPATFHIPSIPHIPKFENPTGFLAILNFLASVIDGLSSLINFVILLFNWLIDLLSFVVTVIAAFFMWISQVSGRSLLAIIQFA